MQCPLGVGSKIFYRIDADTWHVHCIADNTSHCAGQHSTVLPGASLDAIPQRAVQSRRSDPLEELLRLPYKRYAHAIGGARPRAELDAVADVWYHVICYV